MERKQNGNVEINLSEVQIITELLCPECRESVRSLFELWNSKRIEDNQRLQQMATNRTEEEIEKTINEQIEKQIERSDD